MLWLYRLHHNQRVGDSNEISGTESHWSWTARYDQWSWCWSKWHHWFPWVLEFDGTQNEGEYIFFIHHRPGVGHAKVRPAGILFATLFVDLLGHEASLLNLWFFITFCSSAERMLVLVLAVQVLNCSCFELGFKR